MMISLRESHPVLLTGFN